jgi:flagellar hook-length control protein FliK
MGQQQQPNPQGSAPGSLAAVGSSSAAQAPSATAAAAAPLPPAGSVMSHAIETIHATMSAADAQGNAQARITLNPAALGDLTIHLRQTDEGLVARVVATSPDTAATLSQSSSELRRTLDGLGVTVLSLDIGTSQQQQQESAAERNPLGEQSGSQTPAADQEVGATSTAQDSEQSIRLPDGLLVDVQA